jgi:predicted nucleic acid-binding protein
MKTVAATDAKNRLGATLVEIVDVVQTIHASRDPKDHKFLEAAANGRADVIVSGDGDLLELSPFRGIVIPTPHDYLDPQVSPG